MRRTKEAHFAALLSVAGSASFGRQPTTYTRAALGQSWGLGEEFEALVCLRAEASIHCRCTHFLSAVVVVAVVVYSELEAEQSSSLTSRASEAANIESSREEPLSDMRFFTLLLKNPPPRMTLGGSKKARATRATECIIISRCSGHSERSARHFARLTARSHRGAPFNQQTLRL